MMICAGALVAGCSATGRGTAPRDECRGREPVFLTAAQADTLPPDQLRRIVAGNENLERECGVRAPNPSGRRAR